MKSERADVIVVGAGPAGLAAAAELRRLGAGRVAVLERESESGGIPRHTRHTGYGLRDLHRPMSGPSYARRYAAMASAAGAEIHLATTVTHWAGPAAVAATSADGLAEWRGRAVLLATGCRERPRAARLIPGSRPAGVLTTGALQQATELHGVPVGRRAVVVGAEHVSFSAVHTLTSHGVSVVAVITAHMRPQSYRLLQAVTAGMYRVPVLTSTDLAEILGRHRVEGIRLTDRKTGQQRELACDTVVFTGDWIPDNELARSLGLAIDPGTRGPVVDQHGRTSTRPVFAAGNLTHAAETADVAAIGGRHAARAISRYLRDGNWPAAHLPVRCGHPLTWISPPSLTTGDGLPSRGQLIARASDFTARGHLEVSQDGTLLHREHKLRLVPNRSITLSANWISRTRAAGGPIDVSWDGTAL